LTDAVAVPESTDLSPAEQEAATAALAGIDSNDLVLPMLKVTQQSTREVSDGSIESGHYLNALTGTDYGDTTELIAVTYFKGRLYSPDKGEPGDPDRTYLATEDVAPSSWPEEYAGRPFADIPEAEETWKARANDPEDDFAWGHGPPIQTTHNYVGYVPGDEGIPVRLSLKSTATPTARKINSILSFAKAPWAAVLSLSLVRRENAKKQPYYVVEAARGRQTTADERGEAVELFNLIQRSRVQLVGDETPSTAKAEARASVEKSAEGALGI